MFLLLAIGILSVLLLIILVILSVWTYFRVSCGICKCSNHLVGKVVIITGGNAGIGYETAKDLAERGARVILACRSEARGVAARDQIIRATGNTDVHYRALDLSSLNSVRKFSENIINTEKRLDILINNAGIYGSKHEKTEDGLLLGMQSNHFGPFLLTNLFLPLLKASAPSRIINVSSIAHTRSPRLDMKNLNGEKHAIDQSKLYGMTKLCNILMTVELHRRLEGTGVTSYCLHPGAVVTKIFTEAPGVRTFTPTVAGPFMKTPWEGAQTMIYLAVSPDVVSQSGLYFKDCNVATPSKFGQDKELARKLWEESEKLVNLKSEDISYQTINVPPSELV